MYELPTGPGCDNIPHGTTLQDLDRERPAHCPFCGAPNCDCHEACDLCGEGICPSARFTRHARLEHTIALGMCESCKRWWDGRGGQVRYNECGICGDEVCDLQDIAGFLVKLPNGRFVWGWADLCAACKQRFDV